MNQVSIPGENVATARRKMICLLVPLLLFLATFSAIVATIDDYGLTWDEKCYIDNAQSIDSWFGQLSSPSSFSYESINRYWNSQWKDDLTGNVHPPFIKLSALFFRHTIGPFLFDSVLYQSRISTAFWASLLVLTLFWVIRRLTGSSIWGLLGGLTFLAVPRFFAEAHLYTTDLVLTALGFLGLSLFVFASRPTIRVIFGGVVIGAALATKFTGILALALLALMIVIAADRKRFLREYACLILVAFLFFSLFNLPLLFNPGREFAIYFSSFLNREKIVPISTLYFGTVYDYRLPLAFPWVMFGITLPPLVVVTAVLGLVTGVVGSLKNRDLLSYFSVVPFLVLMAVYMLPGTPKHDGIRLLSSAWPFIILLSMTGCRWLQGVLPQRFKAGMAVAALSLLLASSDVTAYHPYELSYYNRFIGGTKGAQDKGFIVSYWYDAFNRDFFRKVSEITGNQAVGVYSYPNDRIVRWNQEYGFLPAGLQPVPQQGEYRYILVLNRILLPEMLEYLGRCKPLLILRTRDGAFIGGLYENR
jgi:4-amino-4-deoxy-L-arabinose transferase-like glycosyltransferase